MCLWIRWLNCTEDGVRITTVLIIRYDLLTPLLAIAWSNNPIRSAYASGYIAVNKASSLPYKNKMSGLVLGILLLEGGNGFLK